MAGSPCISKNDLISLAPSSQSAGYGDLLTYTSVATLLNPLSGATTTATTLIPAKSCVLGVACRVTTTITGATSFNIGDGTTANLFGATVGLTAGTTTDFGSHAAAFGGGKLYVAATSIVLTAVGSNFTGGAVRIVVYYVTITPPVI